MDIMHVAKERRADPLNDRHQGCSFRPSRHRMLRGPTTAGSLMKASNTSRKLACGALGLGLVIAFGIAGCGGSSAGMGTGQMTLSVADAPVDGAQKVVVEFTAVELVPETGNPVDITFASPKAIDLLNQSGTASAQLFDQAIPAGSY